MGFIVVGEVVFAVMEEMVFTKNCITGNAYARMNCTSQIDTIKKFLDYQSSLKKNAYKIGLIPIIS